MNSRINSTCRSGSRELTISRIVEAPPARVFATWTQRLPEWWGPHGMTIPVWEIDPRPGGVFRTVMRAPDGTEYATRGVFLEVVHPSRIVFTDAFEPGWVPHAAAFFTSIACFDALLGEKTLCTIRALHWTTAAREEHALMGFHPVWSESLDRLASAVLRYSPLAEIIK